VPNDTSEVELGRPARALGEHHEQAFVLEQPHRVLGQAGELPDPRREPRHERHALDELFGHALAQPRRVELEERGRDHHERIDRPSAGVIADEHRPPARWDVVGAECLHVEVAVIEEPEQRVELRQLLLVDAVVIDAVARERDLERVDALGDVAVGRQGEERRGDHRGG
jgi:hypothetical protein